MKLDLPKVDFAKLRDWSAREWTLVAGGTIILSLFVFYLGFYRPKSAAVSKLKQHIEAADKKAQAANRPSVSLSELDKKVKGLEERLRKVLERMSGDIQLVQVLRQLGTLSDAQKISVDNIKVREAKQAPGRGGRKAGDKGKGKKGKEKPKAVIEIRTQEVEMTLYGSYESIAQYLEALKELPVFLVVENLEVEHDPAVFPNLKVLLTLRFQSVKQLPNELLKS